LAITRTHGDSQPAKPKPFTRKGLDREIIDFAELEKDVAESGGFEPPIELLVL
jgi:hypothetical protein